MRRLGIIADDLTGAHDTGAQFARQSLSTSIAIDERKIPFLLEKVDVVVINTESRSISSRDAYQRVLKVGRILFSAGVDIIYKKVDSTLRGNLGAEMEAVLRISGARAMIFAPALPARGRITIGGYHLWNNIPISKTEIALDFHSPVKESHIPTLLRSQTKFKIGSIPLGAVLEGSKAISKMIKEEMEKGARIMVADAVSQEDLREISTALVESDLDKVIAGSAGLAKELPKSLKLISKKSLPVLVVAGSLSEMTREQVDYAEKMMNLEVLRLCPEELLTREELVAQLVKRAAFLLKKGKDIILFSAPQVKKAEQKESMFSREVREKVLRILGKMAEELLDLPLRGIILTGGEVTLRICQALKASSIEVMGEVEAGIPYGRIWGGKGESLAIVTKAGAFGGPETLSSCIRFLHQSKF